MCRPQQCFGVVWLWWDSTGSRCLTAESKWAQCHFFKQRSADSLWERVHVRVNPYFLISHLRSHQWWCQGEVIKLWVDPHSGMNAFTLLHHRHADVRPTPCLASSSETGPSNFLSYSYVLTLFFGGADISFTPQGQGSQSVKWSANAHTHTRRCEWTHTC